MTLRDRLEKLMDDANDIARELHKLSGGQTEWMTSPGRCDLYHLGDTFARSAEEIEFFFEDPNNADLVAAEVE